MTSFASSVFSEGCGRNIARNPDSSRNSELFPSTDCNSSVTLNPGWIVDFKNSESRVRVGNSSSLISAYPDRTVNPAGKFILIGSIGNTTSCGTKTAWTRLNGSKITWYCDMFFRTTSVIALSKIGFSLEHAWMWSDWRVFLVSSANLLTSTT